MSEQKYNIGIGALKMLACFVVVWIHNGQGGFCLNLAVPVFTLCSFFLLGDRIVSWDYKQLLGRIKRIVIPLWAWGLIGIVVSLLLGKRVGVFDIVLQFMLGHVVACPLYYLSLMIIFTVFFWLILRLDSKKGEVVLLSTMFLSYIMQYTGVNSRLFSELPPTMSYPLGRIAELLPAAVVGYFLRKFFDRKRAIYFGIVVGVIFSFMIRNVLHIKPAGFGYSGVELTLVATAIFLLFVRLDDIRGWGGGVWENSLIRLTGFSSGIYFCHDFVGVLISKCLDLPLGWVRAIAVFFISLGLVLLLSSCKWTRMFVK